MTRTAWQSVYKAIHIALYLTLFLKVPYFVSWFDMAISGLDMLETFLQVDELGHANTGC